MVTSMWWVSLAALLTVDVRIRALQQKDVSMRRCHHCSGSAPGCAGAVVELACPADRPLCATVAVSPNFTSELTCAAAGKNPCSLTHGADAFTMLCTCTGDLCNSLYSQDLQRKLHDFTSSNITKSNSTDFTEEFFKQHFANVTEQTLYKVLTVETHTTEKTEQNSSHPTTAPVTTSTHTTVSHPAEEALPRAEAFKHEPTALSEDDEDASEGSGAYEDPRLPRQPASDPADPSSFLPANENKAHSLGVTFLVSTPILMYFTA